MPREAPATLTTEFMDERMVARERHGATIGGNALAVIGTAAISSTLTSAAQTITSASASAFTVGLTGATNPAFSIDASTASSARPLFFKISQAAPLA